MASRFLLAGVDSPLAKAFIKNYKSKIGMIALDPSKADFSGYAPLKDVFNIYNFDSVIFFVNSNGKGLSLFKNLQYASIKFGIKSMITVIERHDKSNFEKYNAFDSLVPELVKKDRIGTLLNLYGVYGDSKKTSVVASQIANAKKGKIEISKDEEVNLLYQKDAAIAIFDAATIGTMKGVYDITNPQEVKLSQIANTIQKHIPSLKVTVTDETVTKKENINIYKFIHDNPKFKFTTLADAIAGMLDKNVKKTNSKNK